MRFWCLPPDRNLDSKVPSVSLECEQQSPVLTWKARAGPPGSGKAEGPVLSATGNGAGGEWTSPGNGPHPCPQAQIGRRVEPTVSWVLVGENVAPDSEGTGLLGGGRESLCPARKTSLMASQLQASLAWKHWRYLSCFVLISLCHAFHTLVLGIWWWTQMLLVQPPATNWFCWTCAINTRAAVCQLSPRLQVTCPPTCQMP